MSTIQVTIAPRVKTTTVLRTGATGLPGAVGAVGPQGSAGIDGIDGREVQLQKSSTHVQWRYEGETAWSNLVALSEITGPQGSQGIQGIQGLPGSNGSNGTAGADGADGVDGREVELRTNSTHVQWRYVGTATWTDLVSLASITGPQGSQGPAGPQGPAGADSTVPGPQGPVGPQGSQGPAGSDASVTSANITTALGFTPDSPSSARTPTAHKSSHATGGSDALTASDIGAAAASHTHPLSALTQSAATNGQVATWNGTAWVPATPTATATTDASLLTSGTLADARLSSNVSLDNQDNNFSVGQTITQGTLTAQKAALAATATWNNSGVTFTGLSLNVTDTASNASSLLMDLRVGGASVFSILKTGRVLATSVRSPSSSAIDFGTAGGSAAAISYSGCFLRAPFQVRNASDQNATLQTDAAEILAQRNGTNAQTFRLYGTFSDSNNGRRLDITSTTAGVFTLTATGNGTGASGNILKLTAPVLIPAASVTLATNGDLAFEATSNTTLTIRYRGSDGTTRASGLSLDGGTLAAVATARAWVNFNGTTSPGTIRSSYNVSSITKSSTGIYQINFSAALADSSYSVVANANVTTLPDYAVIQVGGIQTTSAVQVVTGNRSNGTITDCALIFVQVFGN